MSFPGKQVTVSGLRFHVVDEGTGPALLLLQGFPSASALWRHQIPALTGAGFRVIALDLRGFGDSDKPDEVEAYAMPLILGDVNGVLDALGVTRAAVVGHDWGAVAAWLLASVFPARVEKLTAMAVGHPSAFRDPSIEQREKSWYILFFQFEVAEEALRRDDWRLFREWSRDHPEVSRWIAQLSRPGALRGWLNWYRANAHPARLITETLELPPVQAPTLGVFGATDAYVTEEPMRASGRYVAGPWRYERIERAGHWMQLDQPERVTELLLDFLKKSP